MIFPSWCPKYGMLLHDWKKKAENNTTRNVEWSLLFPVVNRVKIFMLAILPHFEIKIGDFG
jgi:hypothetical protein